MNETKRNFRVGSSVTEKGEGPILRIIRISKDGKQAVCEYYDGKGNMSCSIFHTDDFVPAISDGQIVKKKEGGPLMIVDRYITNGSYHKFICSWPTPEKEGNDELHCHVFDIKEIELANE